MMELLIWVMAGICVFILLAVFGPVKYEYPEKYTSYDREETCLAFIITLLLWPIVLVVSLVFGIMRLLYLSVFLQNY